MVQRIVLPSINIAPTGTEYAIHTCSDWPGLGESHGIGQHTAEGAREKDLRAT
jgi:hypothetical protein